MSHEIDAGLRENLTEILNSHGYDANGQIIEDTMVQSDSVTNPELAANSQITDDAEMIEEYVDNGGEVTYDEVQQEVFKTDLLMGDANAHALFRQIESDGFLNTDGSFSEATLAAAKAHNMSDAEIQGHQNSIYKQMETIRTEAFKSTGFQVGYMSSVMDWARANFTNAEMNIFVKDCETDMKGSLMSVERYYQKVVVDGGAR